MISDNFIIDNVHCMADITKEILIEARQPKQIVIVEFDNKKCLTFLVDDTEKPYVPGFPAKGLDYFDGLADARKAVENLYKKIGHIPKFYNKEAVWRA